MTAFRQQPDGAKVIYPGHTICYNGEEIGMTGPKPDEMIHTPIQWSREKREVELSLTEGPLTGNYQAAIFGTLISFLQGS